MIRLKDKIYDILFPLKVPTKFMKYSGKADTYIVYNRFDTTRNSYSDDEYTQNTDYWQIDMFSKNIIQDDFIEELIERMEQGGFYYDNEKQQEYLQEIETYWYAVRFFYIMERNDK